MGKSLLLVDTNVISIDNNDYPRPFFKEVGRERIYYTSKKERETVDTIYILQPNVENIKECFDLYEV